MSGEPTDGPGGQDPQGPRRAKRACLPPLALCSGKTPRQQKTGESLGMLCRQAPCSTAPRGQPNWRHLPPFSRSMCPCSLPLSSSKCVLLPLPGVPSVYTVLFSTPLPQQCHGKQRRGARKAAGQETRAGRKRQQRCYSPGCSRSAAVKDRGAAGHCSRPRNPLLAAGGRPGWRRGLRGGLQALPEGARLL